MCNEVARRIALGQLREDWAQLKVPLVFPEGLPNLGVQDSIRITDTALVLRASEGGGADGVEGVMRRWSWPGQGGRPVYNYRSEGRAFAADDRDPGAPRNATSRGGRDRRCLIPVDAFFEFTAPEPDLLGDAPPRSKKTKWRFTAAPGGPLGPGWFCIAGVWRSTPAGEAFALLTGAPGPDVAPYHHRQVMLPARAHWAGWLDGSLPAEVVLGPAPKGALTVERV